MLSVGIIDDRTILFRVQGSELLQNPRGLLELCDRFGYTISLRSKAYESTLCPVAAARRSLANSAQLGSYCGVVGPP